ncbi:hypothetical protein BC629DRAFT_1442117 [Irpex lacteus]|nr:hypothetical protein BC629DRAFT_1442117 [Irpex lacteus]
MQLFSKQWLPVFGGRGPRCCSNLSEEQRNADFLHLIKLSGYNALILYVYTGLYASSTVSPPHHFGTGIQADWLHDFLFSRTVGNFPGTLLSVARPSACLSGTECHGPSCLSDPSYMNAQARVRHCVESLATSQTLAQASGSSEEALCTPYS